MHMALGLAEDAQTGGDLEQEEDRPMERTEIEETLRMCLLHFTPTPAGLGSGHADTVSKTAAATHSLGLSCPDINSLSQLLHSFASFTTDMGVEMSLPGMRMHPNLSSFAPAWLRVPTNFDGEDL